MPNSKKRKIEESDEVRESSDYELLLSRLESSAHSEAPAELKKLISNEDLQKLLHYLLQFEDRVLTRRKNKEINEIKALEPNQAYRLNKEQTFLPRTLTILRAKNGEYKLIAETKSKLQDNTKQELSKEQGASKSGKPAWCLDDMEEYFNLVAKLEKNNDEDLDGIKAEVQLSQILASKHVSEYLLGPVFEKDEQRKVSVYSKRASGGNLTKFLERNRLNQAHKNEVIKQLLIAVKYFHDHDTIHQDLKPENILVFGNLYDGFVLKLTDFGCSANNDCNTESLASAEYASPELKAYYSRPDSLQYEYFQTTTQNTFGNQPLERAAPRLWGKPDKANDIWALGIMIFEILNGRLPNYPEDLSKVEKSPLLNGLLQVNRYQRFTIDEALNCHLGKNPKKRKFQ